MSGSKEEEKDKQEKKDAGYVIARKAAAKKSGCETGSGKAGDFNDGYDRGREMRDNNKGKKQDKLKKELKSEYGNRKSKEEREAYKKGYAEGSAR